MQQLYFLVFLILLSISASAEKQTDSTKGLQCRDLHDSASINETHISDTLFLKYIAKNVQIREQVKPYHYFKIPDSTTGKVILEIHTCRICKGVETIAIKDNNEIVRKRMKVKHIGAFKYDLPILDLIKEKSHQYIYIMEWQGYRITIERKPLLN